MKRREAKSKGEKERYSHLNAEFQRIARRDKKAFLSDQCKEIEKNNRMGKTRDLFKKIRDTKGIFHAKMGSIKDRNSMDLTEAEDIKKRWQEYRRTVQKKIFTIQIIRWCDHSPRARHPGMWSQVGLRKASLRTKLVEVMEFQLSYFKSWKVMLWKCCAQCTSNLENSAVATELEKVSFHSNPKVRQCQRMYKLPHNCTHLTR